MLAGQMTTSDPTRSPAGTESFWAYTHVPQRATSRRGDERRPGHWDRDDCERFADRMQARLERLRPGLRRRGCWPAACSGPRELEARDANLVGGALNGGTAQLHQQLVFRPVPGSDAPRPRSAGCTSARRRRTPAAGCTAPAA